jgi:hypothetical protein
MLRKQSRKKTKSSSALTAKGVYQKRRPALMRGTPFEMVMLRVIYAPSFVSHKRLVLTSRGGESEAQSQVHF